MMPVQNPVQASGNAIQRFTKNVRAEGSGEVVEMNTLYNAQQQNKGPNVSAVMPITGNNMEVSMSQNYMPVYGHPNHGQASIMSNSHVYHQSSPTITSIPPTANNTIQGNSMDAAKLQTELQKINK